MSWAWAPREPWWTRPMSWARAADRSHAQGCMKRCPGMLWPGGPGMLWPGGPRSSMVHPPLSSAQAGPSRPAALKPARRAQAGPPRSSRPAALKPARRSTRPRDAGAASARCHHGMACREKLVQLALRAGRAHGRPGCAAGIDAAREGWGDEGLARGTVHDEEPRCCPSATGIRAPMLPKRHGLYVNSTPTQQ